MAVAAVYQLSGMTLDDHWVVTDPVGWKIDLATGKVIHADDGSGGNFSACYFVEKREPGKAPTKAFLKGIDISRAMGASDMLKALKEIVDTANFEKELLKLCGERKMDRVVLALASGDINLGPNIQDSVPYIIFELADGDVRRRLRQISDDVKAAWTLRAMHNATVGLSQLHSAQVAHQDVKPSNVLDFEDASVFKLGDVGRALREGVSVPHENANIAGDPAYAPPELLYGWRDPDWRGRRLGCDLYLLGSLVCFFFLGQGTTPLLMKELAPEHRPLRFGGSWAGSYQDALPFVRRAFSKVLMDLDSAVPEGIRQEIISTVRELCEPDVSVRGHPLNRAAIHTNRFGLERYVSQFDLLARHAEVGARGRSA